MLFTNVQLVFAQSSYNEIFSPLITLQNILKYLGAILLILSLIAQGIIIFFSDNIPDGIKKTMGKAVTGGCLIGGASAIASLIMPGSSMISMYNFLNEVFYA